MSHPSNTPASIRFLFENSVFLIAGALAALIWANFDEQSYQKFVNFDIAAAVGMADADHGETGHQEQPADGQSADGQSADGQSADGPHGEQQPEHDEAAATPAASMKHAEHGLTLHFLVNDILMALFFAIAAKEVFESLLPGGSLSNPKKAATPLIATLGGILGPASIYLAGAAVFGQMDSLGRGWAIPCATDIAFSYLVARLIFGNGHPAIAFLLLLAIADDAAGLVILAVAYPSKPIEPMWFLLTGGALALCYIFQKTLRLHSFWWYLLIPGVMSWYSFQMAGIHAALGLVPVICCMPHAKSDLGLFAQMELNRHDTLNEFEHWWKYPVEIILGIFGLANAGVVMNSVGVGTWMVVAGLLIGKPVGITLCTLFAEKVLRLEVPAGMSYRHVITLGMIAGIGFTVALFVSTAAFKEPGAVQDSVKMGALLSFGAAPLAFMIAKMLKVKPTGAPESTETDSEAA